MEVIPGTKQTYKTNIHQFKSLRRQIVSMNTTKTDEVDGTLT